MAAGAWMRAAILAAGCVGAVAAGGARAAKPAAGGPCFMWEASSPTGTVYLLGSVHVGHPSLYPLAPAIEAAFSNADALAVEVLVTPEVELQSALLAAEKGTYPPGQSLAANLAPETLRKLRAYLAAQKLTLEPFANMRPWLLGLTLVMREYVRLGYDPKLGIDAYFTAKAGERPILELETIEKQLDILSGGTRDIQDLALREMLDQIDSADDLMRRLLGAWQRGDGAAVDGILRENMSDDTRLAPLHRQLLDDRNVDMAAKIAGYLRQDRTTFVIVGAAHLVGTNGIVRLLQDRGCALRQVGAGAPGPAARAAAAPRPPARPVPPARTAPGEPVVADPTTRR